MSAQPLPHLSTYFDLNSFNGRLRYNWSLCNPLNLQWGAVAVAEAQATIERHHLSSGSVPTSELQHAQTVLAVSAPHGTLLPAPCRTSGWALATVPVMAFIVANAVSHPTSLLRIVAGQWANQTQNAAITWSNRPPATPKEAAVASLGTAGGTGAVGTSGAYSDDARAIGAYCASCLTAIPIAVGAAFGAHRSSLLRPLGRFAPYPAVALANTVNTMMMRSDDWMHGVTLQYADGTSVGGSSRVAGQRAVRDTALTRTLIPLANFVVAPLLLAALEKLRGKSRSLLAQVVVSGAVLIAAIPMASSVSAPVGKISLADMEPELAQIARMRGVVELQYERGF